MESQGRVLGWVNDMRNPLVNSMVLHVSPKMFPEASWSCDDLSKSLWIILDQPFLDLKEWECILQAQPDQGAQF